MFAARLLNYPHGNESEGISKAGDRESIGYNYYTAWSLNSRNGAPGTINDNARLVGVAFSDRKDNCN